MMTAYSMIRDCKEIKKALEYFANHIIETLEPEII